LSSVVESAGAGAAPSASGACAASSVADVPALVSSELDGDSDDDVSVSVGFFGAVGPFGLSFWVAEEADGDEAASDGSARATAGMVATAVPTPSATASAPTRPTYLT
jgi:hypothetical protein